MVVGPIGPGPGWSEFFQIVPVGGWFCLVMVGPCWRGSWRCFNPYFISQSDDIMTYLNVFYRPQLYRNGRFRQIHLAHLCVGPGSSLCLHMWIYHLKLPVIIWTIQYLSDIRGISALRHQTYHSFPYTARDKIFKDWKLLNTNGKQLTGFPFKMSVPALRLNGVFY